MTDAEITSFAFEGVEVRTVDVDGETWWVAADVAGALGITNGRNMVARLDEDEKGVHVLDTPGGPQRLTVINEPGLFMSILRSNSTKAAAFKRWISHEVLPAIRRAGTYTLAAIDDPTDLALPHDYLTALEALLQRERANVALTAENQELAPRALAWDDLASAAGDYAVADAAKMLARAGVPTGPQRLFDQLGELGWTFRGADGKWRAYADRVNDGFLSERPQSHHHPRTGLRVIDAPQIRVTIKGLERLRQRLQIGALKAVTA